MWGSRAWEFRAEHYYPWGGAPQIWIDPSTLLVPVGHDAKGFGLCCFATAAVCSLSCLLPFIAPHPSMSLAVYVKSRHPFYSHLCKCYFIAKSRWLGIVRLAAGGLVNPKGCGFSAYREPCGSKCLSVLREKQAGPPSGCFLCINVFPLWYLVSCF